MTVHNVQQTHPQGRTPEWWTVSAWVSLGLLVLAGLAGAVGVG